MSDKEFINNLSSTYADVRRLDVKKIKLNGENLEDKFGFKQEDYPKLVTRTNLDDIENYVLYDDFGNPVYVDKELTTADSKFIWNSDMINVTIDLSKATSTTSTFEECHSLKSYEGDLSSTLDCNSMFYKCTSLKSFKATKPMNNQIASTRYMFSGCTNLEEFYAEFPEVSTDTSFGIDGFSMFSGCCLNKESAINIINDVVACKFGVINGDGYINMIDSNAGQSISLGLNSLLKGDQDVIDALGSIDYVIHASDDEIVNNASLSELNNTTCFISNNDGTWHTKVDFDWNYLGTEVTSEHSASTSNVVSGYKQFMKSPNLVSFNAPLTQLVDSSLMFAECPKLETFESDLSSLEDAGEMFRSCSSLRVFNANTPKLTRARYMFSDCLNLEEVTIDLSELTDWLFMFVNCRLNKASTLNLISQFSAKDATDKTVFIGVNKALEEDADVIAALEQAAGKGWTITLQYR